ncbi:protein of unknown function [Cupriavidus taiwanensis]|nr:protein of unknown function [Cupriavidus taiwanensis]
MQQEHVIRVEVGAHAAAVGGVADHHVVEAGVGDEAEATHQIRRGGIVQVDALHQQGPLTGLDAGQVFARKWTMREFPAVAEVRHQARFDIVAIGEIEKRIARHRRHNSRHRLSNEHGLAMPDIPHECSRRHATKQVERSVWIDGARGQGLRV